MRSGSSGPRLFAAVCTAFWLCVALPAGLQAQTGASTPTRPAPADGEIAAALAKVKADPNLAQERKTRTLRWRQKDEQAATNR